jgi:hypothetical protein
LIDWTSLVSRPLRSTPTPASRSFPATTGRSASERRDRYSMPRFLPRHAPSRALQGLRPRAPVSTLAFSRSMQEPQTRITPPLRRTPPGQQRGQPPGSSRRQIRSSVSMSSQPVSTPQTTTPDPSTRPDRTILERLPGPHLTRSSLAFSLDAHHDGLQPTQLQGGLTPAPAGPTPEGQQSSISRTAPLFRNRFLHQPPSAFVTHGPPGSRAWRLRACTGSSTPRGPTTARDNAAADVAFRFL